LLLSASSASFGYSKVIPPCPSELSTCTMAWQDMHPSPFCPARVFSMSRIGYFCIWLAIERAWSWQPPHQSEGLMPTVSCMYSSDFRYHSLLNDAKWCIELCD